MKHLLLLFFLISAIGYSSCYASTATNNLCQENRNRIYCGNGSIDHINYLDDVIFNGTTVTGHTKIVGDVNATHTHFNTLDITGDLKSDHTQVAGIAKLMGDQRLEHFVFHSLANITGDAKLSNVEFLSNAKIVGDLSAEEVKFNGDLTLSSTISNVTNTNTQNIEYTPSFRQQVLYLNNSRVNGNIKFSSNNGVIYKSSDSIIKGTVIGGKVISR